MASLTRKPNSPYWYCCFTTPDGSRTKRSTKQTNRREALAICQEVERAASKSRRGLLTEAQARKIVGDIVEYSTGEPMQFYTTAEWLRHWAKGKSEAKSPGTAVRYNGIIEDFIRFLGKRSALNLSHLTVRDIHSYRTKLKETGLAPNTCNFAIRAISGALNAALRQGLITTNPATAIESLPKEQSGKTPFTQQQIKKLSTVSPPDWKLAILLGYCTGLRIGDIANMTWNAVDFEKGVIQIVPKKTSNIRKVVFIPVHSQLKDALLDAAGQDDPEAPHSAHPGRETNRRGTRAFKNIFRVNGEGRYRSSTLPQGRRQRAHHEPAFIPFFAAQLQLHAGEQGYCRRGQATTDRDTVLTQ